MCLTRQAGGGERPAPPPFAAEGREAYHLALAREHNPVLSASREKIKELLAD